MEPKHLTKIFIVTTIIVIAVFDVYVWSVGGTEATISWTMFKWSHEYPVFTFAMGFVMGHLFWQMKGTEKLQGGEHAQDRYADRCSACGQQLQHGEEGTTQA